MNGLASMGSGLGAALGVQLADRDRSVVAICGDGVFAMMSGVIATAAAYELPLVVLVLNDQRFGMVELGHKALYGRTPTFSTGPLSVASLARALGADGHVVRHPGEIAAMDLAAQRGPVVLDVHIDRSVRMPKNARFDELKQNVAQPPLPRESQAAL